MNTFSIITVVYNDKKNIDSTIKSVINQNYKNFEYIIVDGNSDDGTFEIIKSYSKKLSFFISENDKGIYDAMNKGLNYAKNDWVIFMNSGDLFVSNNTLKEISAELNNKIDLIYGNHINYKNHIIYPSSIKNLWQGSFVCHQSTVIKTKIMKKLKFDLKYKIASDYDFFLKLFFNNYSVKYINLDISKVSRGGLSDNFRIQTIKEFKSIIGKYNKSYSIKLFYDFYLIPLNYLKLFIKKVIK